MYLRHHTFRIRYCTRFQALTRKLPRTTAARCSVAEVYQLSPNIIYRARERGVLYRWLHCVSLFWQ